MFVKNAHGIVSVRTVNLAELAVGFSGNQQIEETHLTHLDRLEKLVALLAIGFCWAHKIGQWCASIKPIYFKRFTHQIKPQIRPQYSYFRYGLNYLRNAILQPHQSLLNQCLKLFIPPPLEII